MSKLFPFVMGNGGEASMASQVHPLVGTRRYLATSVPNAPLPARHTRSEKLSQKYIQIRRKENTIS